MAQPLVSPLSHIFGYESQSWSRAEMRALFRQSPFAGDNSFPLLAHRNASPYTSPDDDLRVEFCRLQRAMCRRSPDEWCMIGRKADEMKRQNNNMLALLDRTVQPNRLLAECEALAREELHQNNFATLGNPQPSRGSYAVSPPQIPPSLPHPPTLSPASIPLSNSDTAMTEANSSDDQLSPAELEAQSRSSSTTKNCKYRHCEVPDNKPLHLFPDRTVGDCSQHEVGACFECLRNMIADAVDDGWDHGCRRIVCPTPECGCPFSEADIRKYSPSPVFTKYLELKTQALTEQNETFRRCPWEGCSAAQMVPDGKEQPRYQCHQCHRSCCFNCSTPWHADRGCYTFENDVLAAADARCPSCGQGFQKDGGCEHMTCSEKNCQWEFCVFCLVPYDSWKIWGRAVHDPRYCPFAMKRGSCTRRGFIHVAESLEREKKDWLQRRTVFPLQMHAHNENPPVGVTWYDQFKLEIRRNHTALPDNLLLSGFQCAALEAGWPVPNAYGRLRGADLLSDHLRLQMRIKMLEGIWPHKMQYKATTLPASRRRLGTIRELLDDDEHDQGEAENDDDRQNNDQQARYGRGERGNPFGGDYGGNRPWRNGWREEARHNPLQQNDDANRRGRDGWNVEARLVNADDNLLQQYDDVHRRARHRRREEARHGFAENNPLQRNDGDNRRARQGRRARLEIRDLFTDGGPAHRSHGERDNPIEVLSDNEDGQESDHDQLIESIPAPVLARDPVPFEPNPRTVNQEQRVQAIVQQPLIQPTDVVPAPPRERANNQYLQRLRTRLARLTEPAADLVLADLDAANPREKALYIHRLRTHIAQLTRRSTVPGNTEATSP